MADTKHTPYGRIYCVTNKINGKQYVGQTLRNLDARWRQHALCYGRCRAMENAIKKYGVDAFSVAELAIADTQCALDALEQHYIQSLNTISPAGYNLSSGGRGIGRMHHPETKDRMRGNSAISRTHAVISGDAIPSGCYGQNAGGA